MGSSLEKGWQPLLHANMYVIMIVCMHVWKNACLEIYMYVYKCAFRLYTVYTHARTHTHTHICIHMYLYKNVACGQYVMKSINGSLPLFPWR